MDMFVHYLRSGDISTLDRLQFFFSISKIIEDEYNTRYFYINCGFSCRELYVKSQAHTTTKYLLFRNYKSLSKKILLEVDGTTRLSKFLSLFGIPDTDYTIEALSDKKSIIVKFNFNPQQNLVRVSLIALGLKVLSMYPYKSSVLECLNTYSRSNNIELPSLNFIRNHKMVEKVDSEINTIDETLSSNCIGLHTFNVLRYTTIPKVDKLLREEWDKFYSKV
jgi:hypothetical protein